MWPFGNFVQVDFLPFIASLIANFDVLHIKQPAEGETIATFRLIFQKKGKILTKFLLFSSP